MARARSSRLRALPGVALGAHDGGEAVGGVRVAGAQARLVDVRARSCKVRAVIEVALIVEDEGEVVEAVGGIGVVGTQARLTEG